jgi:hypothetical protein
VNQDFLDLLAALLERGARFLVVGAHAMAIHGVPRATGDMDLWIDSSSGDSRAVWEALLAFGAPMQSMGFSRTDLEIPDRVIQIGIPPRRIDVLTTLSGLDFEGAWSRRVMHSVATLSVPFLSREDLIRNKRATGRSKDLADLQVLEGGQD